MNCSKSAILIDSAVQDAVKFNSKMRVPTMNLLYKVDANPKPAFGLLFTYVACSKLPVERSASESYISVPAAIVMCDETEQALYEYLLAKLLELGKLSRKPRLTPLSQLHPQALAFLAAADAEFLAYCRRRDVSPGQLNVAKALAAQSLG